jgi:hypothetical protein
MTKLQISHGCNHKSPTHQHLHRVSPLARVVLPGTPQEMKWKFEDLAGNVPQRGKNRSWMH